MTSPSTIDYSPLTQRVGGAVARQVREEALDGALGPSTAKSVGDRRSNTRIVAFTIGGFFVLLSGIIAFAQWVSGDNGTDAAAGVVVSAILTEVCYVIALGVQALSWRRTVRLVRFARANGFAVEPTATPSTLPGTIFQPSPRGTFSYTRDVVSWTQDGYDTEVGLHIWVHKGQDGTTRKYLAMRLDAPTPQMSFDFGPSALRAPNTLSGVDVLADEPHLPQQPRPRLITASQDRSLARTLFTDDLIALLTDDDGTVQAEVMGDYFFAYYGEGKRLDVDRWRLLLETAQLVAQNADALRARAVEA